MTHDELLELINNYKIYAPVDYGQVDLTNALRAVVELHKPETESPKCNVCKEGYPCSTIESIEKELL